MFRFLLAPAAALVMLASAPIASAQVPPSTRDPELLNQYRALTREVGQYHREYLALERTVNRCQDPDPNEIVRFQTLGNEISQHVGAFAPLMPGRQHEALLKLRDRVETDFWQLGRLVQPDRCYVPPAA